MRITPPPKPPIDVVAKKHAVVLTSKGDTNKRNFPTKLDFPDKPMSTNMFCEHLTIWAFHHHIVNIDLIGPLCYGW